MKKELNEEKKNILLKGDLYKEMIDDLKNKVVSVKETLYSN